MSSPHPLKTRSIMCGSLPVFMVPLIIFSEDTSGNRLRSGTSSIHGASSWLGYGRRTMHSSVTFISYVRQTRYQSWRWPTLLLINCWNLNGE